MTGLTHPGAARGPELDNRRVLAGIVDVLLMAPVALVVSKLCGGLNLTAVALTAAWALFYYFALESGDGRTLGKRLLGIRVVRADGGEAGMREVAIRTVLRTVDGLFVYLVGLVVMLATGNRRQRLGDLAAGTVIASADAELPPADARAGADVGLAEPDAPSDPTGFDEAPDPLPEAPQVFETAPEALDPLPEAPQVFDTAPEAPDPLPEAPQVFDTAPEAPDPLPEAPQVFDTAPEASEPLPEAPEPPPEASHPYAEPPAELSDPALPADDGLDPPADGPPTGEQPGSPEPLPEATHDPEPTAPDGPAPAGPDAPSHEAAGERAEEPAPSADADASRSPAADDEPEIMSAIDLIMAEAREAEAESREPTEGSGGDQSSA